VQRRDFYHFRFLFIPLLSFLHTSFVFSSYLFSFFFIPLSSSWAAPVPEWRYGEQGKVTVPIVFQTLVLPVVEVSLNGRGPYRFLVDTGGTKVMVDPRVARAVGLKGEGRITLRDLTGAKTVELTTIEEMRLGTLTVSHLPAVIGSTGVARLGEEVHGVLGLPMWTSGVLEMDYPRARLTLHDPEKFTLSLDGRGGAGAPSIRESSGLSSPRGRSGEGEGVVRMTLFERNSWFFTTSPIQGLDATVLVDTGWQEACSLNPAFARRAGLGEGDPNFRIPVGGWGGGRWIPMYRIPELPLAGLTLKDVMAGQGLGGAGDAIFGAWLLKSGRWWFDFPGRQMWVSLPQDRILPPPEHRAYLEGMKAWGQKDWSAAIEAFGQALRHEPAHEQARLCLAYSYREAGRFEEAKAAAEEVLNRYPGSTMAQQIINNLKEK